MYFGGKIPISSSSPSSDSASDSPSDNSIHPYDCFPRWVYTFPSAASCLISNSVDVPGVDTKVDSDTRSDSTVELRSYSDEGSEIRLGFGMLLFVLSGRKIELEVCEPVSSTWVYGV